jgi:hypothetical protein
MFGRNCPMRPIDERQAAAKLADFLKEIALEDAAQHLGIKRAVVDLKRYRRERATERRPRRPLPKDE